MDSEGRRGGKDRDPEERRADVYQKVRSFFSSV